LRGCVEAIREHGGVPAITAVLDGVATVGVDEALFPRLLGAARKTSSRDLARAIAQQWTFGATTVAAALTLAATAGVAVFATGGIGGVHRGAEQSGDVSADLGAIAAHPVVTVCAGAKAFLDLARTLEQLETLSVPVIGFATDTFPAFTMRSSGLPVPARVDRIDELAAIASAHWQFGGGGLLVAVPIPETQALDAGRGDHALEAALAAASAAGVTGAAVTPFVLEHIAQSTGGDAVIANIALAINNASIAAQLAARLTHDDRME
jgi:pseudouridine-5'-phosphate glycosidase